MKLLSAKVPTKGNPFPSIKGPKPHEKTCIVGAGPAGIHMAVRLKDHGYNNLVIFEKSGRVGGKSSDTVFDGFYRPQGAIFLTVDYFDTLIKLAKRYGVGDIHALEDSGVWSVNSGFDKRNKFSSAGYQLKTLIEMTGNTSLEFNVGVFIDAVVRYTRLHYALFGKYNGELMQQPNDEVLKQISGTFLEFIEKHNLHALIPLFHRVHTSQGEGYLDEIGALYGLLWNTPKFLITYGLRALGADEDPYKIYMLKDGFENVWNTIVAKENFDIRYFSDIDSIDRNEDSVELHVTKSNSKVLKEKCDFLIWTPPMPELLNGLLTPFKEEIDLFSTLSSHVFVATLMKEKGVIRNRPITYYQESVDKKIDGGVVADGSLEDALNYCEKGCPKTIDDYSRNNGSQRHITVLQLGREAVSEARSNEIARAHYEKGFNASSLEFLNTKTWEYFYKWSPDEVAKGNHWKVFNIQGLHRTWYAGSSVCMETIKSVLEYNELLLRQMKKE